MKIEIDYDKITEIEFEGIDGRDAPDFCDAHIVAAWYIDRPLTDDEIDELNDDSSFVYEALQDYLY
jgi:hypothetical protein